MSRRSGSPRNGQRSRSTKNREPESSELPGTIFRRQSLFLRRRHALRRPARGGAKRMRERRWRIHRWWSSAPCQLKMSEKDVVALLTSGAMTRNRLPSAATPQSVAMPGAWNNVVGEPTDSTG